MAAVGFGYALLPKATLYTGCFWFLDDISSPCHQFLVYHSSMPFSVRAEEHKISSIQGSYQSATAMLGYGYVKVVDGIIQLVENENGSLVDYVVRENLRIAYEQQHRRKLSSRGATAQDVFSAIMQYRCPSLEPRNSTDEWRRMVWQAHTSLSFDDKYKHPTPELI